MMCSIAYSMTLCVSVQVDGCLEVQESATTFFVLIGELDFSAV